MPSSPKTNFKYSKCFHLRSHSTRSSRKYPKTGVVNLYGRSDTDRFFAIYFANPCFRYILLVTSARKT